MKQSTTPTIAASEPLPAELQRWCASALGEPPAQVELLAAEASHRQFYRLRYSGGSVVLMVSPPQQERNHAFISLSECFVGASIPVPAIRHQDHPLPDKAGWFIMDDLGPQDYAHIYGTDQHDVAIDQALKMLHRLSEVSHTLIEAYDSERIRMELALFQQWYVGGLRQLPNGTPCQDSYALLEQAMLEQPQGCVHRDYHCRNLMFNEGQLGIVDFQDALHGPLLYDPASLLRDCYHTFDEAEIDRWLSGFAAASPPLRGYPYPQIKRWFDFTAIQRQLKAIGIFARLHLREGKSSHLAYIDPLIARLTTLTGGYEELGKLHDYLVKL